jgi:hypothetical protein
MSSDTTATLTCKDCPASRAAGRVRPASGWVSALVLGLACAFLSGCTSREDLDWAEYRKVVDVAGNDPARAADGVFPWTGGSMPFGTHSPYGSGMMPYGTGIMPYGTGIMPYGTGFMPYGTGMQPYGSGWVGFGTGSQPYGTGFMPYGTGSMPPSGAWQPYGTGLPAFGTAGQAFGTAPNASSLTPFSAWGPPGATAVSRDPARQKFPKYGTPYPQ